MVAKYWYLLGRAIVALYARWVLKIDIQLRFPLPEGASILVANHPSTTDPAWLTILSPEPQAILIKDLLFKVPLFGHSLRLAGHIPVVKGNGKAALEEAAQRLKSGQTVVIFPEGEISPREGGLQKTHTGAARLALLTGAPVIPVGIGLDQSHLREVLTRVDGGTELSYWYLRGRYALTVGAPMHFKGTVEDRELVQAVLNQMMQRVSFLAQESSRRVRLAEPVRFGLGHLVSLGWQLFARMLYVFSSI